MQIKIDLTNNLLDYSLSHSCFLVDNNSVYLFCNLSFDLNLKPEIKSFLQNFDTSISLEELEEHLPGGYFIICYSKIDKEVICFRDTSGLKSGYYTIDRQNLIIGTNCHKVAKAGNVKNLNKKVTDTLLATEFIIDGHTIYEGVKEFFIGTKYVLDKKQKKFCLKSHNSLDLAVRDNDLTYDQNKKTLRDKIIQTHSKLAGNSNVVYLSGGIDSCVMLAALDEVVPSKMIHNVSYRVKGTNQDETYYAKKAATHLGYDCEVIDIDPQDENFVEALTEQILEMNNPYIGMFIFMPQNKGKGVHYFAGQDTRLHTPDINFVDQFCFNLITKGNLKTGQKKLLGSLLKNYYKSSYSASDNKVIKNLDRLASVLSPEDYLKYFLLKANPYKLSKLGLEDIDFSLIKNYYPLDLKEVKNNRDLFNKIVQKKWGEQYTDDIRYMSELGSNMKGYMQMPFYDIDLSRFSSSIPFEYTTKYTLGTDKFSNDKVKVNKVLLREAFAEKLSPEVVYRKKAVSLTVFLLFNGALGKLVKSYILKDLKKSDSLIKEFGYEKFINKFLSSDKWEMGDQSYLLRIYYLFIMILLRGKL